MSGRRSLPPQEPIVYGNTAHGNTLASFKAAYSGDLGEYRAQPGNWNVQATKLGKGVFSSDIVAYAGESSEIEFSLRQRAYDVIFLI